MKYIAKIIYTLVICRFLMCIRERLVSNVSTGPEYLLIEYIPSTGVALLFGYADNLKTINQLMCDLLVHGFETVPDGKMTVVNPIGNNMFKFVHSEERIGPCRLCSGPYSLCSTSRGRWYDIAKRYGMKREVINRICGMK